MKKVIIATTNAHKVKEIAAKLEQLGAKDLEFLDLRDYPGYQSPLENGETFAANAQLKALAAAQFSGYIALADDSGLTVEALDGAPGVYSARYAGPEQDDAANNAKLLQELAGLPLEQRQAAFQCAIAIARPEGQVLLSQGQVEGYILMEPWGEGGFGYDPLFYVAELKASMAQLSLEEKNRISHRARGLEQALPLLLQVLDQYADPDKLPNNPGR